MASKRKQPEQDFSSDSDQEDLFVDASEDDSEDNVDDSDDDFEDNVDASDDDSEENVEASEDESDSEEEPDTGDEEDEEDKESNKIVKEEKDKEFKANNEQNNIQNNTQKDEYEYDSSDEEDIRNTVGNIPMEWYREFAHIGYNLLGQKIIKPKSGDEMDEFLNKMDNPDYWRTVMDKSTGQQVVLSDKDVSMIERFRKGKYVDPTMDPYEPSVDFFTHEKMETPLTAHPPQKRSFIPSKWEKQRVSRLLDLIKQGKLQPLKPVKDNSDEEEDEEEKRVYALWNDKGESEVCKRYRHRIPAPKTALPRHDESYHPPEEYLFTEEEEKAWKEKEPEERRLNFIPRNNSSLRTAPQYERHMEEPFHRCLDLYLCPRQRKMRMNVNPEDLLPKLPKPRDLMPFPNKLAQVFRGHTGIIQSISVSPCGKYLVSGSNDGTVRVWEVAVGRCFYKMELNRGTVKQVAWNPNPGLSLVAVAVGDDIIVIPVRVDGDEYRNSKKMLAAAAAVASEAAWDTYSYKDEQGLIVKHKEEVKQISWHKAGDYIAAVEGSNDKAVVVIHQLSRRRSQKPLKKPKGLVQRVAFHPARPYLFVATQRYVRIYNLLKQELTKKVMANCRWVSSLAIHPGGDNIVIGSYDCKVSWCDLDLSSKPYQTLRHHSKAVRAVAFHPRLPLFASASDDGKVIVSHGRVFDDLLNNPLIVPVKILRGHEISTKKNLGVLDVTFHPFQPYLFSSGADCTIRMFHD